MFEGPQSEVLAFGTIHVDIGEAPATRAVVDAEVGVGEVRVTTPDDVTVEIRADVDDGDVRVNDVARRDGTIVVGPEGPPDVIVHAKVERGSIEVEQHPVASCLNSRTSRSRSRPSTAGRRWAS